MLISGLLGCIGAKDVTNPNKCMVSILSIISADLFFNVQNLTPQSLKITAACLSDSGRPGFDLNNDSLVDAPS